MEKRKRIKMVSLGNVEDTETEGAEWGWSVYAGRSDVKQTSLGSNYRPQQIRSRIFIRRERRGCRICGPCQPSRDPRHLKQPSFEKFERRGQEECFQLNDLDLTWVRSKSSTIKYLIPFFSD